MLPVKSKKIANSANPDTTAFIHSVADITEKTSELEIKSRVTHKKLTETIVEALKSAGFLESSVNEVNLPVCDKIRYKSIIYSTAARKEMDLHAYLATSLYYSLVLLSSSASAVKS